MKTYEVWYEDQYGTRPTTYFFPDKRPARAKARQMNDKATRSHISTSFYVVEVTKTRLAY